MIHEKKKILPVIFGILYDCNVTLRQKQYNTFMYS